MWIKSHIPDKGVALYIHTFNIHVSVADHCICCINGCVWCAFYSVNIYEQQEL